MRFLIKVTQLLPALFIGFIIAGIIARDTSTIIWGVVALVVDFIIGSILQYISDRPYYKSGWMDMNSDEQRDAITSYLKNAVKESEVNYNHTKEPERTSPQKKQFTTPSGVHTSKNTNDFFCDIFFELEAEGGSRFVEGKPTDTTLILLFDTCSNMTQPPQRHTLYPIFRVDSKYMNNGASIVYSLRYRVNSICENAFVILVRTHSKKLRLFTVETDGPNFFLCEYTGHSHLNYGIVQLHIICASIDKIIGKQEPSNNKPPVTSASFYDVFFHLEEAGGSRCVESARYDEARTFLYRVCENMTRAPSNYTLFPIYEVKSKYMESGEAIAYSLRYRINSVCENAFIVLLCDHSGKLRLFAVKTNGPNFFICEYSGQTPINHGDVQLHNIYSTIDKIINK